MVGIDGYIDQYLLNYPPQAALEKLGLCLNQLGKGDSLIFLCILLLIFGYFLGKRELVKTSFAGFLTLMIVAPTVQTLKHLIGRARPKMNLGEFHFIGPHFFKGGFDSFPSGHSMASFALASVLSHQFPKGRYFFYGTATLIALVGRVSLRNHYLTDVIVGGMIGYFIGRAIYNKFKNK